MILKFVLLLVVGTSTFGERQISGIEQLSLNANRADNVWTISATNGSSGQPITVSANVPGGVYSDLEDSGVFSDGIYHEYNDVTNRWVGRSNWTLTRTFTASDALLEKESVVLVCEGLDTVSDVFINDEIVGSSENMFVRYIFDIKSALTVGENVIRVAFRSPVEYAQEKFQEHLELYGYPVLPESLVPEYRGENQAQMIRKMQSAFSWDWGPSYPNSGIWKDIYIEGYNNAIIRDVMIFTTPSKPVPDETENTVWNITARIYYDSASAQSAILRFHRFGSVGITKTVTLEQGEGLSVDVTEFESGLNTKLWWPNGYGDQHLYWYNVSLSTQAGVESSNHLIRIGFRTVELIEDLVNQETPEKGREFYFIVNGLQMYSKGSNSIPLHVLPERVTEEQTEWLLRAAKMSHQNMIRVWGGGMYETEVFYDYADEYGIFIWEDFMFACSMYPATDEFRANVEKEVTTQVKRLQRRPSLVMWAANNENEAALRGNWYGTDANFSIYRDDYVKLYIDTIKVLTEELDPSRQFLSSSPTNGKQSEEEGWVAENPYQLIYGDIHFYNYTTDNWDWETFLRTRYASEYGYQSFPHYETLALVAEDITTWTWDSPQMEHRQHHPKGQEEIRNSTQLHFPFPENYDSTEAFPYMLYLAQLSQIMGQKTQTEFYRRLQDKMNEDGAGHNMGALYWQLNDIWEGCSWASVEVHGKWKLQMYYAVKFFAPVLASPFLDSGDGDLVVELMSDSPQQFNGVLHLYIYKLSSMTPVFSTDTVVHSEFLRSKEVVRVPKATLDSLECSAPADSGAEDPCVVYLSLPGTPDNFLFLQYPKNKLALKDPSLQITGVEKVGDNKTIRFNLEASAVAPFVFLTVRDDHRGYFSDNGFLQVETAKKMTYYSENGITDEQFVNRIEILSLFNVTAVAGSLVDGTREGPVLSSDSEENSVHSSSLLF